MQSLFLTLCWLLFFFIFTGIGVPGEPEAGTPLDNEHPNSGESKGTGCSKMKAAILTEIYAFEADVCC